MLPSLLLLLPHSLARAQDEPPAPPPPAEPPALTAHGSQVQVKHRVAPKYPEEAMALDLDKVTCEVRFYINEHGAPYEVRVEGCPEVFHAETLKAAWQWRFNPMVHEGRPVPAQFVLRISYVLKSQDDLVLLGGGWVPPLAAGVDEPRGGFGLSALIYGEQVVIAGISYRNIGWGEAPLRAQRVNLHLGVMAPLLDRESATFGIELLPGLGVGWWRDAAGSGVGLGGGLHLGLPATLLSNGKGVGIKPSIGIEHYLLSGGLTIPMHATVELFFALRSDG